VVARARSLGVPVLLVAGGAEGEPPAGVEVVTGGGEQLDADHIARLVRRRLHALLGPGAPA
jgi:hypothetical protein